MDKIIPTESLIQFYERTGQQIPKGLLPISAGAGHCNVRLTTIPTRKTPFNRRDYFKICLSSGTGVGKGTLVYNDQEIQLHRPCIIFTNPSVPTSIEINYASVSRYGCIFNKQFIEGQIPPDVQYASPLFNASLYPVITLTEAECDRLNGYFGEMQLLQESDYPYKWEMVRNMLQLLIHEGIRLQQTQLAQPVVVRDRLVNAFFSLLNQQFPVDSPENSLKLLTPAHFADQLHVHVNHLNSVVKKHSGKSTRTIIHERIVTEAKALLRNTNWNIAEIAYALGFEYPSHFNKYFKQFSAVTPVEFRLQSTATPAHL
jgi:AraC family transcriptional activator of pobA